MIKKKICTLGAFAVGKTSMVRRFVESIFSEKYYSTLAVKIDKKKLKVDDKEINLLLWDLYGEDEFMKIRSSYLRGTSGYILVADVTRRTTLATTLKLQKMTEETVGKVPFILALNKVDIELDWDIDNQEIEELSKKGWNIIRTSAKTGENVENVFITLTRMMLNQKTNEK